MHGALKRHAAFSILAFAILVAASIPVILALWRTGDIWQGVPPSSDNYYYARMHEIKDGYPFIGNPYFLEHRNERSPAFFVADWIAAFPLIIGIPIIPTIVLNLLLWSFINALLFYTLFRVLGCTKRLSAVGAFLTYILMYNDLLRPVSLQVIAPAYTLMFITGYRWLENPLSRRRMFFFTLALTVSVYAYTYLMQIAFVFLGLNVLLLIWRKHWKELQALILISGGVGILSLPFLWYSFLQVTHPFYWETMTRIGLVNTHLPTYNAFTNFVWVSLTIALWFIALRLSGEEGRKEAWGRWSVCLLLMGITLIIVSFSNVITGKELEIAQHLMRFIVPWIAIVVVTIISLLVQAEAFRANRLRHQTILTLLIFILFLVIGRITVRYSGMTLLYDAMRYENSWLNLREDQSVGPPLAWLEENEAEPKVIWAPSYSPVNDNITILTKHYVLFSMGGILHLVPDNETERRYLISRSLDPVTIQDIERDHKLFAGTGNAIHPYKTHNRGVLLCRFFRMNLLGYDCGKITDSIAITGEKYFTDILVRLENEVRPNLKNELRNFHVSYVIHDHLLNTKFETTFKKEFPDASRVYSDSRFSIYKLAE